jgi:hypothetical protein
VLATTSASLHPSTTRSTIVLLGWMDEYASANFTFTQDKLEDVFTIANQWIEAETRPVELMHYGIFAIKPSVDPKAVVVLLVF